MLELFSFENPSPETSPIRQIKEFYTPSQICLLVWIIVPFVFANSLNGASSVKELFRIKISKLFFGVKIFTHF